MCVQQKNRMVHMSVNHRALSPVVSPSSHLSLFSKENKMLEDWSGHNFAPHITQVGVALELGKHFHPCGNLQVTNSQNRSQFILRLGPSSPPFPPPPPSTSTHSLLSKGKKWKWVRPLSIPWQCTVKKEDWWICHASFSHFVTRGSRAYTP